MKDIIQIAELKALQPGSFVLIDATGGPTAADSYSKEHLAQAYYVNLEQDLSAIDNPAKGGRHPLPSPADFTSLLTSLGIQKDTHVIVYDRLSGSNAAARFWWMMKSIGHANIQVLDGGFQEAKRQGYPTVEGDPARTTEDTKAYPAPSTWQLPTVNMETISKWTEDTEPTLIVDVREEARYQGLQEPIDLVAGHIPTAINIPYAKNLNDSGLFKSSEELKDLYAPVIKDLSRKNSAIHCGSGVTACHTLLAIAIAGLALPSLYVGSWSEWSRNKL